MLHGCPPSPDAWGRLNVVTPFHHLSGDSHINSSLRAGPLRHLIRAACDQHHSAGTRCAPKVVARWRNGPPISKQVETEKCTPQRSITAPMFVPLRRPNVPDYGVPRWYGTLSDREAGPRAASLIVKPFNREAALVGGLSAFILPPVTQNLPQRDDALAAATQAIARRTRADRLGHVA